MKRLFIILIVLCPYIPYGHLQAQMYSTSSRMHHSYSTGGTVEAPSNVEFRSTSVYNSNIRNTQQKCYSTAPMNVANGAVKTVASSIRGGVLSDADASGYLPPTAPKRSPGVPNTKPETPIGDGWDVAVFLLLLCAAYVIYLKRKSENGKVKG